MKQSSIWIAAALCLLGVRSSVQARGFGRAGGGVAVGPRGGVATGGYRSGGFTTPSGGVGVGRASHGTVTGPYGGVTTGGSRGGTYVTPRGTTVQGGKVGGVHSGPLGGVQAGGASGVRVTTPGGKTYTDVNRGGVAVGPRGGVAAGGSSVGVASGPRGTIATGSRGGIATGPYGGVYSGGSRGGVAIGAGNVAVANRSYYVSPNVMSTRATVVRNSYYNCYTRNWYTRYPAAWRPARWAYPNWWAVPAWTVVAPYCGVPVYDPIINYDYGSTIVYNDNRVYNDGVEVGTAEQYAEQAADFANKGREAKPNEQDEYQSLGVFALVQGEEQMAQQTVQLAINKAGIVRGNYYNALTEQTTPVYGSLDKKTQRVAWSFGEKKDIVMEAGLNNLTQPQTTAVVHYGKDRTVQLTLVRLEEPKEEEKK